SLFDFSRCCRVGHEPARSRRLCPAAQLGTSPRVCKPPRLPLASQSARARGLFPPGKKKARALPTGPSREGPRKKARLLPAGLGSLGRGCLKGPTLMLHLLTSRKCEKGMGCCFFCKTRIYSRF